MSEAAPSEPQPTRRRGLVLKLLVPLLVWLALEGLSHVALIAMGPPHPEQGLLMPVDPEWLSHTKGGFESGFYITDPACLWRPRPGFEDLTSSPFWGHQPLTINQHGHRSPNRPLAKEPGVRRVMVLGGSHPFGLWVGSDETYAALLERRLNAADTPYRWEVMNAASPGHTTFQGLAYLETHGLASNPDIVIFDLGVNDELPLSLDFARPDHEVQAVADWALSGRSVAENSAVYRLLRRVLAPLLRGDTAVAGFGIRVPPLNRELNLAAAGQLGQDLGFAVLYMSQVEADLRGDGSTRCLYTAVGFEPIADVCGVFGALGPGAGQHFVDPIHVKATGHALIADLLFARLDELGWLTSPEPPVGPPPPSEALIRHRYMMSHSPSYR